MWVKKLWARHRHANPGKIRHPAPMGRPAPSLPGRREHSAVLSARYASECEAVRLEDIEDCTGLHMPHNTTRYWQTRIW